MTPIDLLINARWIIPIQPACEVLEHFAIAIHQGKILALLPQQDAAERYQAARVEHLNEHVIMPGLINAHAHIQDERGGTPQPLDYTFKLWLASGITTVREVGAPSTESPDLIAHPQALSGCSWPHPLPVHPALSITGAPPAMENVAGRSAAMVTIPII